MINTRILPVALTAFLAVANAPLLSAQENHTYEGELRGGDETLTDGEFVDKYSFQVSAGQRIVVDLRSSAFDTYIVLKQPSGQGTSNDDYDESTEHSRIELIASEAGEWTVWATSYGEGETGSYELTVSTAAGVVSSVAAKGETQYEQGALDSSDEQLDSGEYRDKIEFSGIAGEQITFELRSHEFDPYLIVNVPGGAQFDNDDYEGDVTRSRVVVTLPRAGTVEVVVTTYEAGETGTYDLWITRN